jgi:acyl carrier protein
MRGDSVIQREIISNEIIRLMHRHGYVKDTKEVDFNSSLGNELGINSLGLIELIVGIEKKFNFKFNDSQLDIDNYKNIKSLVDTVFQSLNGAK